eukprot:CAMPEP_0177313064 /NCGR_PEP_ID=MMETSP0368-20130122/11213_1 /TAXON_ID=447022 ORGANISM="Scrippsiella hangoei-like, Strain SHHI-4" /NCGR_SAMPLE_ID=MMETSP0368 /ASSEMBLY_ACC=CAM_ASM_000363 /LENGTH=434 /DNA_ID=CAMNT_0018772145 /DNA_START=24 /DNA_END=1328 /DNA_ORIENTATION=+
MDATSPLHENASWMLQTALDSVNKADSLYEYCQDAAVELECRRLGLSSEEIALVRVKQEGLQDVKAVGTTGKRSVMLAVTIALLMHTETPMKPLWQELKAYKLDQMFLALVQSTEAPAKREGRSRGGGEQRSRDRGRDRGGGSNDRGSLEKSQSSTGSDDWGYSKSSKKGGEDSDWGSWRKGKAASAWKEEEEAGDDAGADSDLSVLRGVGLQMILGNMPVITLDSTSVFYENVSWLIQTAFDISGKADGVYEYIEDSRILAECRRKFGMSAQETGIAQVKRPDLQHLKAVGTTGKRSMMLSVLVAFALHVEDNLQHMRQDVIKFDAKLGKAFEALICLACQSAGKPCAWRGGPGGRGGGKDWAGAGASSPRPAWSIGSVSDSRGGCGGGPPWTGMPPRSKAPVKKVEAVKPMVNVDVLDSQLEDYFNKDSDDE